jgi:hypothetical protein
MLKIIELIALVVEGDDQQTSDTVGDKQTVDGHHHPMNYCSFLCADMRDLYRLLVITQLLAICFAYHVPRLPSRARTVSRLLPSTKPIMINAFFDFESSQSSSRLFFGKKVSDDDDILQDEDVDFDALDDEVRPKGEAPELDVLSRDLEDEDDDDDDDLDEDEDGDEDEEGEGADAPPTPMEESPDVTDSAWLLRRKMRDPATRRKRKTWEDKYEDNPYKSAQPTVNWNPEPARFDKWYLAIAQVENDDMTDRRSEAWLHHMQWVRRAALHPSSSVTVAWDYTRLSGDYMNVEGQAVAFRANDSDVVLDLLKSEPLSVHGGVTPWRVFEMEVFDHNNTDWYFTDPFIFTGTGRISDASWQRLAEESKAYHSESHKGIRVSQLAYLRDVSAKAGKADRGLLVVYNAKTTKSALKYLKNDPLMAGKSIKESVRPLVSMKI